MRDKVNSYLEENPGKGVAIYGAAGAATGGFGAVVSLLDGQPDGLTVFSGLLAPTIGTLSAVNYVEKYQEY